MLFEFLLGAAAIYAFNMLTDNTNSTEIRKKKEENRKTLQRRLPDAKKVIKDIKSNGYLSTSFKNKIEKRYATVFSFFRNIEDKFLDDESLKVKKNFLSFISDYNTKYIRDEKLKCKDIFHIGKYVLDDEQQTAVITDEDNNLVLAGAGSGKTLTIMGKVNYLVKRKHIAPKDILLIAFARKAAEEMTTRIQDVGIDISAQTFHKLGLDIISEKRGFKPKIAEENFTRDFLIDYFVNKIKGLDNSKELIHDLVEYFAYYLDIPSFLEDCKSLGEMYAHEKSFDLTTLKAKIKPLEEENLNKGKTIKGEQVKSLQEVHIANFLFLSGVEYDYEREYPYKSEDVTKGYNPDFCIYINGKTDKENCIWLEHFGVNKDDKTPWLSEIEEIKYLDGIRWKREFHKKHNTILEETYSYNFKDNTINEKLINIIQKHNITIHPIDYEVIYNSLRLNMGEKYFYSFIRFCETFISLFKSSNCKIEDIDNFVYSSHAYTNDGYYTDRLKVFKRIIKNIIIEYEKALKDNGLIDFSDMIIEATNIINNSHIIHNDNISSLHKNTDNNFIMPKYKYVIIDEFQDISCARSHLVKAILDKTKAHLFCVGDDWQSIYRFTGSDIGIFLNFHKIFGATKQMSISNTYRNSQDLINLASQFIQKNPNQIKKILHSNKKCNIPVRFYLYTEEYPYLAIEQAIEDFIKDNTGNNLMILGRTNFDKEILLESTLFTIKNNTLIYTKNKKLNIEFLTAHKSKGLEADNVIILNFNNEKLGFPNKIIDDPLLELVLTNSDAYQYAEERRLLYVALTRTKNRVSLITDMYNSSEFLKDLDDVNYSTKIITNGEEILPISCPHCQTGNLIIRTNQKTHKHFLGCTNYPKCNYTINDITILQDLRICPKCGGYLVKRNGKHGQFYGCKNYPHCIHTEDLIEERDDSCKIENTFILHNISN